MSMPAAEDLFRPTAVPDPPEEVEAEVAASRGGPDQRGDRAPSGRVKHDEKMTVYITTEELLDLEHARLTLRRTLGTAVDRGRLVRAAVALALADLEENGEHSAGAALTQA
ncbi:MAG: hypothetical protein HZY75_09580 [Nocardioidaceae bacterium]|nr:MAG: hypothetical protein HZY75_09580 [Nocardioidaceae bacterium]